MSSFIYLITAGITLLIFVAYYYAVLKSGKNFVFNRIYLVAAGMVSLILSVPEIMFEGGQQLISYTLETFEINSDVVLSATGKFAHPATSPLIQIYLAGIAFFTTMNLVSYFRMRRIIRSGIKQTLYGTEVLVSDAVTDTFSFLNRIVVPATPVSEFVIRHEQAHVNGRHTMDLLFAEVLCTVLWFVPFIRSYKKAILLNHEFIADQAGIATEKREAYCEQLLAHTFHIPGFSMSHTFMNTSLTKNRITMMYKNPKGPIHSLVSYLLIIPVAAIAIFISSCKDELQKSPDVTVSNLQHEHAGTMPEFPGGNNALITFLSDNITYPETAKVAGVEGKVFVKFVVSSTGNVKNVEVIKGVDAELDAEALRVARLMPDWKPAMDEGKAVDMQMTLPIMFALK